MVKGSTRNWIYGLVSGGVSALTTVGYLVAVLALPSVVNPSSTAGIAHFLVPFYALFAGVTGFLAGLLAGWIIDLILLKTNIVQNVTLLKLKVWLVLIAGIFDLSGISFITTYCSTQRDIFIPQEMPLLIIS